MFPTYNSSRYLHIFISTRSNFSWQNKLDSYFSLRNIKSPIRKIGWLPYSAQILHQYENIVQMFNQRSEFCIQPTRGWASANIDTACTILAKKVDWLYIGLIKKKKIWKKTNQTLFVQSTLWTRVYMYTYFISFCLVNCFMFYKICLRCKHILKQYIQIYTVDQWWFFASICCQCEIRIWSAVSVMKTIDILKKLFTNQHGKMYYFHL